MKPSRWSVSVFSFVLGVFLANAGLLASRYLGPRVPRNLECGGYFAPAGVDGHRLEVVASPDFVEAPPCKRAIVLRELAERWRLARPGAWFAEVFVSDAHGVLIATAKVDPRAVRLGGVAFE